MAERRDAVVIGGGPGGLACAATLRAAGVDVLVLERDSVAASWRRHYDRLHLHTWRLTSGLPGLRFSARRGPWVSRDGVIEYCEAYVRHHGIEVRAGVEARRVERAGEGWRIETDGEPIEAGAVVVATGYNHTPVLPDWPGRESFAGELVHGSEYRNAEPYRGKDVLVVGTGNTGAEICVDLVEGGAERVRISVRTPPHISLRAPGGLPAQLTGLLMHRLPEAIGNTGFALNRRLFIGDLDRHGLPAPRNGAFTNVRENDVVPILDVGLVRLIKKGEVQPVAAVESFDGATVRLADGTTAEPDVVIACTGYRRALEPLVGHLGVLAERTGKPLHFGGREHPDAPGLHFVGYRNPLSGMFWEMGWEARRIARAITGRVGAGVAA